MPEMQEQFPAAPWMAGTPEMQEHFPAGAWIARHLKTKRVVGTDMLKMHEQFSAGASPSTIPKSEELPVCRKCRSNFRLPRE